VSAGDGIVLFDCGMHEPGSLAQLERAMTMVNLRLDLVRLLVCTHAHIDHYGQAATVIERAGCQLWMHPNHAHVTAAADDPDAALARRVEIARQSGVPAEPLRAWAERRHEESSGIARVVLPDRPLLPGVEIATDLGAWLVIETPGHAPSHVCLFQPERRLLISGDHLLGRVSSNTLITAPTDGSTDRPQALVAYLDSMAKTRAMDVDLVLPGHGDPIHDHRGLIDERFQMHRRRADKIHRLIAERPRSAHEIAQSLWGNIAVTQAYLTLSEVLGHTDLLLDQGRVRELEDDETVRFESIAEPAPAAAAT
jgi:glyoxylase-like metal-dependent hydrolase (beta-lactamase superfamily II)